MKKSPKVYKSLSIANQIRQHLDELRVVADKLDVVLKENKDELMMRYETDKLYLSARELTDRIQGLVFRRSRW